MVNLLNTFNLSGHGHADSNMCEMDFGIKLCYDFFLWKCPCSLKKGVPLSSATWYNKHLLMKSPSFWFFFSELLSGSNFPRFARVRLFEDA